MNPVEEIINNLSGELAKDPSFIKGLADELMKADAFTGGANGQQLVWYNLDPTVEFLYPYLENVPLVAGNAAKGISPIPAVSSKGGTAAHWKTITAIDPNSIAGGVGRGQRAGAMTVTSNDLSAPFFGLGVEIPTDFETRYEAGSELVPEPLSIAHQSGLRALMIMREKTVVGGNNSVALGTPSAPTVSNGASTGGSLTPTTLSVIVVALTLDGFLRSSVAGGVVGSINRQNMDGSSLIYGGGSSMRSSNGTASVTSSHTMLASVTPVSGAVAYAWYWGNAGSEVLGAITTINGIEIVANATGTQAATAITADNSKNAYVYDGIISQMAGSTFGAASNSYIAVQAGGSGAGVGVAGTVGAGNGLTPDGAGGIVEFDVLLKNRWDNFRIGFRGGYILINSQEAQNITKKILQSPSGVTSLFRTAMEYDRAGGLRGGLRLTSYHNKFTGEDIDIEVHPWVPPGTAIFFSTRIPYPLANVTNIIEFEQRQGFIAIDWPLATRQYQTGFYVDECFKNHFTPAYAMITNLGNN